MINNILYRCISHKAPSTIYALSSGALKCGVAVIRISGCSAITAIKQMTSIKSPISRKATLTSIMHPVTKDVIDKGLVLWFPGPNSFTGEDCVEFQVHGSVAVVNEILKALPLFENFRMAKPGEFMKRSFRNSKVDLTEVEGFADLIQAETEAQRKQAYFQSQGSLKKVYDGWRMDLIRSLAYLESVIDFGETDNVVLSLSQIREDIKKLHSAIKQHLNDGRRGEILRNGVKAVLFGLPNVGKSSLLNLLTKRNAAIVTPLAGTTRDVLQVNVDIGGYPVLLTDTAGLRVRPTNLVEKEGITRALEEYKTSNLVVFVIDSVDYITWRLTESYNTVEVYIRKLANVYNLHSLVPENHEIQGRSEIEKTLKKDCFIVMNKFDVIKEDEKKLRLLNDEIEKIRSQGSRIVSVSCLDQGEALTLGSLLMEKLKELCAEPSTEHPSLSHTRHRELLTECAKYLDDFLNFFGESPNPDVAMLADKLRMAKNFLGFMTGCIGTEAILDRIFNDFCIGK